MIHVKLPQSAGGISVQLKVEVETNNQQDNNPNVDDNGGQVEDNGGQGDDQLFEIKFSPNQIRGISNQTKVAQLVLNQPAAQDIRAELVVVEGKVQEVEFPSSLVFKAGTSFVEVPIHIGVLTAKMKIRAKLVDIPGGDTASLQIEPEIENQNEMKISWTADDIEMGMSGSKSAALRLNQAAPFDIIVNLVLHKGNSELVQFPSQVSISKGKTTASVQIKSNEMEGKVEIMAALPLVVGGKTDKLKVEVKN